MSKRIQDINSTEETSSQLDNFHLSFEYNKTLTEIRSDVRARSL